MRVYLDNCCFNRPYDEPIQETIRLETQAKIAIQDKIKEGKIELIWSFILDFENSENPYDDQQSAIAEWEHLSRDNIAVQEAIRNQASLFEKSGLKAKDAIHLACAIAGKSDYLITTGKNFIKKGKKLTEIAVVNPIDMIYIMEQELIK